MGPRSQSHPPSAQHTNMTHMHVRHFPSNKRMPQQWQDQPSVKTVFTSVRDEASCLGSTAHHASQVHAAGSTSCSPAQSQRW
jgi:LmbE family N-acetylglucosaminyl deacetylase